MPPEDHERLAWAVLELANRQGWNALSGETLASITGLDSEIIAPYLTQPCALTKLLVTAITRRAHENFSPEENIRDALFALLMARFDVLQDYRAAIMNMPLWLRSRPTAAIALATAIPAQLHASLALAGIQPITPLHIVSVSAVYTHTLRAWQQDDTLDLTKTMAMLDRQLGYMFKVLPC